MPIFQCKFLLYTVFQVNLLSGLLLTCTLESIKPQTSQMSKSFTTYFPQQNKLYECVDFCPQILEY